MSERQQQEDRLVELWSPNSKILRVEALTPDASTRRYFRLYLEEASVPTALMMVFEGLSSPEAGGVQIACDQSVVELTQYFRALGIGVPELYASDLGHHALLIEDLGSEHLADCWNLEGDTLLRLYKESISILKSLQPLGQSFPYQRRMGFDIYIKEMKEFEDYLMSGSSDEERQRFRDAMEWIGAKLDSLPLVLSHRDYHSWNLLVDASGSIRIIDFQDALLAPRAYDLVSLLHDRDTDASLGQEIYDELFQFGIEALGVTSREEAYLVALQRDLKVAGRFEKLATERGLEQYRVWIPGTLKRIGRHLMRLKPIAPSSVEVFSKYFGKKFL